VRGGGEGRVQQCACKRAGEHVWWWHGCLGPTNEICLWGGKGRRWRGVNGGGEVCWRADGVVCMHMCMLGGGMIAWGKHMVWRAGRCGSDQCCEVRGAVLPPSASHCSDMVEPPACWPSGASACLQLTAAA
jgi:hypothetical protein